MARDISLLDSIQIATPCHASWSAMKGDDRTRFCNQCSLHVYNIAELTRGEAERLIVETEGRLCARLYRRHDGTVITRDCPLALAAARRHLARSMIFLTGVLTACLSALSVASGQFPIGISLRDMEPFSRLHYWLNPPSWAAGSVTLSSNAYSYTARHQIEEADEDYVNESMEEGTDESVESDEVKDSEKEASQL